MIADYFIVRRRRLAVDDLYLRGGCYEYSRGFNYRALAALAGGIAVAIFVHDYAWFAGFLAAGALDVVLMLT